MNLDESVVGPLDLSQVDPDALKQVQQGSTMLVGHRRPDDVDLARRLDSPPGSLEFLRIVQLVEVDVMDIHIVHVGACIPIEPFEFFPRVTGHAADHDPSQGWQRDAGVLPRQREHRRRIGVGRDLGALAPHLEQLGSIRRTLARQGDSTGDRTPHARFESPRERREPTRGPNVVQPNLVERPQPLDQFEQHDAEREHVPLRVRILGRLGQNLLAAHVAPRSRASRQGPGQRSRELGEPEVTDLGHQSFALHLDEDVGGREIGVDESSTVHRGDTEEHVAGQGVDGVERQLMTVVDQRAERQTFDVFEDQRESAVIGHDFVETDDIVVPHHRMGLAFLDESLLSL